MTFKYDNVYVQETATVAGPYEKDGPLKKYYDKTYQDLYFGEDSWEKSEIKLVKDNLDMLNKKAGLKKGEVELLIGGDLLNQIAATTYGAVGYSKSFMGIYGACSTSVEGMIIGTFFGTLIPVVFYYFCVMKSNIFILILVTLLLSLIGQFGDLVFSSIKRHYKIKDFSNLMPGHGGILDRLDSSIFVILAYMIMHTFI